MKLRKLRIGDKCAAYFLDNAQCEARRVGKVVEINKRVITLDFGGFTTAFHRKALRKFLKRYECDCGGSFVGCSALCANEPNCDLSNKKVADTCKHRWILKCDCCKGIMDHDYNRNNYVHDD